MEVKKLTCIECPIGCDLEVTLENGKVVSDELVVFDPLYLN